MITKQNLTTTKHFGDYSVSLATVYFLAEGNQVLFPYGDRGKYDLAIEKNNIFHKVQCKWTSQLIKPYNYYRVSLRVSGINKNKGIICYKYSNTDFDLLWVATPISCYLIPSLEIFKNRNQRSDIKLSPTWDKYLVSIPMPKMVRDENIKRLSPRLTNADKMLIKGLIKQGRTYQEIADILDVSKSCITVQVSRNKDFYKSKCQL